MTLALRRLLRQLPEQLPCWALLTYVAHLALVPMQETDVFFRVAVGREILQTGSLPRRNLFSFTFPEHPDLDSAWLFDLGAALLHRQHGYPALVLAKAALVVLAFALAYRSLRRQAVPAGPTLVTLAAAAFVMQERFTERPHLFSFLGVVLMGEVLARPARARGARALAVIAAATALWTNLHAGAFLAPLLLLAAAMGAAIDERRAGAAPSTPRQALTLALAAAVASAALLLSPVGPGVFSYLAFHLDINAIHPVDEFRRPTWLSDAPLLLYAGATAALLFAASVRTRRPPPLLTLLPAATLALLFVRSVRFGAELTLVLAPLAARALHHLTRVPDAATRPTSKTTTALALALLAAALVPRALARTAGGRFLDVGLGLDERELPEKALAFADRHQLRDRMYNDFELGGYLALRDYPRHRVFVDPRLPAYPRAFHTLLGNPALTPAAWDAALATYGVDTALLGHAGINHRMGWWPPARWALVYRQDDARIFVRRLPRFAALIADAEIPATFRFSPENGSETVPLTTPPADSPVPPCEWQLRLGDLYFDLDDDDTRALAAYEKGLAVAGCLPRARASAAHAWVGAALLEKRHPQQALDHLDRAIALGASQAADHANRGLALRALGRETEARAALQRAAALMPAGRSIAPPRP